MTGSWVLGLDGGGSKTALAYLSAQGDLVGPFYAPGINPFDRPGWEGTLRAFLAAHPAPGPLEHATLGLPGYGESSDLTARQDEVCRSLLAASQTRMNDVQAAFLGAFPDGVGALLLAGTGSMAWASDGERHVRAGGWGEGFGDEGSAYWIGRAALGRASQAMDGRHPDTDFPALLLSELLGGEVTQARLLDWHHAQTHLRSAVAALARTVDALAQTGQPTALTLLDGAASELARHVHAVRAQLHLPALPWSHAGSVLTSRHLQAALRRDLGEPEPPALPPLGGALHHAAQHAGWATSLERLNAALSSPAHASLPFPAPRPQESV